jgi:hypothetical protein
MHARFKFDVSVAVSLSAVLISASYTFWRHFELTKIHDLASKLLCDGYVLVDSISINEKQHFWDSFLLPRLIKHWTTTIPNFYIHDQQTWPQPSDGRSYATSLKDSLNISSCPKLFSSNYEAQAIVAYLLDSRLGTVSYGKQNHWRFILLCGPQFWWSSVIHRCVYLTGDDCAWHLMNWPNPTHGKAREPVTDNAHIDAGQDACYTHGIPTPNKSSVGEAAEGLLLEMLLRQLCILFYCDTPGDLGSEQGGTGFYRGSHIVILEALRRIIAANMALPIDFETFRRCVKTFGRRNDSSITQITIPDGKALLGLGVTVHTLMWATQPMKGPTTSYPRSIQNAKIHASASTDLKAIVDRLPSSFPLRQLLLPPTQRLDECSERDYQELLASAEELFNELAARPALQSITQIM